MVFLGLRSSDVLRAKDRLRSRTGRVLRGVHFGIASKLVGSILLAAVLPLTVAVVILGGSVYRDQVATEGRLSAISADHIAQQIERMVNRRLVALDRLVAARGFPAVVTRSSLDPEEAAALDARWNGLPADAPELAAVIDNPAAELLRDLQQEEPFIVETLIADHRGHLIAASGRSTGFEQSDEAWWQRGVTAEAGKVWSGGLGFDASADMHRIEVALPLWRGDDEESQLVGVLKVVLDATPWLARASPPLRAPEQELELVEPAGNLHLNLSHDVGVPPSGALDPALRRRLSVAGPRWLLDEPPDAPASLIGFAPLQLRGWLVGSELERDAQPSETVVLLRQPAAQVLAPLRERLRHLLLIVGSVILVFGGIGLLVARRHLLTPIRRLRRTTRLVVAASHLAASSSPGRDHEDRSRAYAAIEHASRNPNRDELGDLTQDLAAMARRVLGYQEHLEAEILEQTAELRQDLVLAREFQEALLTHCYPQLPAAGSAELGLSFFHVYQPSRIIGGDFYHLHVIDDHRVGVFIADVMGHGIRSALVTAILRIFIDTCDSDASNPEAFMHELNRHFSAMLASTGQFLFATACYAVIDTEAAHLRFVSAGHPPPIALIGAGPATELGEATAAGPALGLHPDSRYQAQAYPIEPGERLFFYTDGLVEAGLEGGESFGLERLLRILREHAQSDLPGLSHQVLRAVKRHLRGAAFEDDVCLVAVGITEPGVEAPETAAVEGSAGGSQHRR